MPYIEERKAYAEYELKSIKSNEGTIEIIKKEIAFKKEELEFLEELLKTKTALLKDRIEALDVYVKDTQLMEKEKDGG